MAKRESKKSVSLTDPKPNIDVAGPSSMDYKAKQRSTIKWFIAASLILLMIFLGGGLAFLDHFPVLRQFTVVEFTVVVVPDTVKFPARVTLAPLNVIAVVGVEPD